MPKPVFLSLIFDFIYYYTKSGVAEIFFALLFTGKGSRLFYFKNKLCQIACITNKRLCHTYTASALELATHVAADFVTFFCKIDG